MKGRILVGFLAVLVNIPAAQIPTCNLGSNYAVDLNRSLAPGEEITTETGGISTVAQREKPGSTHIVFRRCILPKGTEVVIGGPTPWVKVCGNALIHTEGWTLPLAASQKIQGPEGPQGLKGDPGPAGPQGPAGIGKDGRDGREGRDGRDGRDGAKGDPGIDAPRRRWLVPVLVAIGAAAVTGVVLGIRSEKRAADAPQPVCIGDKCVGGQPVIIISRP